MIYRFEKDYHWREIKIENNLISIRDSRWPRITQAGVLESIWSYEWNSVPNYDLNNLINLREHAAKRGWKEVFTKKVLTIKKKQQYNCKCEGK